MNLGTKTSDGQTVVATKMKQVIESLYMGAQTVDKDTTNMNPTNIVEVKEGNRNSETLAKQL